MQAQSPNTDTQPMLGIGTLSLLQHSVMDSWLRRPYLWLSLLAAAAIAVAFVPVETPDWARFKDEALSIVAGQGYRTSGQLETALPPGYPLLIVLIKLLGAPDWSVPLAHLALFIASCNVVYFTLRPYSNKVAMIGMLSLTVQPLAVRLTGYYLSEMFGMFLCALLLFYLSHILRGAREFWKVFLLGMLSVFLPLTSPATIVMCFCLSAFTVLRLLRERSFGLAAVGVMGALVVMIPWQMHCLKASGSVCPLLLSSATSSRLISGGGDPFLMWYRSWSNGESDMPVLHSRNLGLAPARAFGSATERAAILNLGGSSTAGPSGSQLEALATLAERRRNDNPLSQFVILPLSRSLHLWFEMVQIGHAQHDYVGRISPVHFATDVQQLGLGRAGARWLKGVLSTVVYGLYVSLPVFALLMLVVILKRKNMFALLMLLSIAAYTLLTGLSAGTEARRNVVFFPAILFLLSLVSCRNGAPGRWEAEAA